MEKQIPSFDTWIANQKGFEVGAGGRYHATLDYETRDVDPIEHTMVVTISTDTKDRMGDILSPGGINLKNYKKNPVVLWAHKYDEKPIAKALWVKAQGNSIISKPQFANTQEAQEIFNLYRDGFLNAWSVGFVPDKYEERYKKAGEFDGYDITSWELLEYSAVPVPANPDALNNAFRQGKIKSPRLIKAFGLDKITEDDVADIEDAAEITNDSALNELNEPNEPATQTLTKVAPYKYCVCDKCGYYEAKKAGEPCQEITCPECGEALRGSNEQPEKVQKPEETADYIHIPVRDVEEFQAGSLKTIDISKDEGIKAVVGKLEGKDSTTVQKYMFDKAQGWTMAKAKEWVAEREKMIGDPEDIATLIHEMKSMGAELAEIKEGRVLSKKNRDLINSCVTEMKQAITALNELIDATEDKPKEELTYHIELEEKPKIDVDKIADAFARHIAKITGDAFQKSIEAKRGKI